VIDVTNAPTWVMTLKNNNSHLETSLPERVDSSLSGYSLSGSSIPDKLLQKKDQPGKFPHEQSPPYAINYEHVQHILHRKIPVAYTEI